MTFVTISGCFDRSLAAADCRQKVTISLHCQAARCAGAATPLAFRLISSRCIVSLLRRHLAGTSALEAAQVVIKHWESKTAQATQSRSNPVSGRCLPKTGIFQISAGDYRRFRSRSGQFGSPETDSQFAKARHWRAFLRLQRVKSPGAGLPGWRRSADRTGLQANSLLTGNFTGNFAISGFRDVPLKPKVGCIAATSRTIPYRSLT